MMNKTIISKQFSLDINQFNVMEKPVMGSAMCQAYSNIYLEYIANVFLSLSQIFFEKLIAAEDDF